MRMPPVRVFRRSPVGRRVLPEPVPTDFAADARPGGAATPAGSATATDTGANDGAAPTTGGPTNDGGPVSTPGATTEQSPAGGSAPDAGQDGGRRLPARQRLIRPCAPGDAEYALPLPAG